MRPKFSMWSDYGAPAQRQWMSASRRGNGSSVGPKILLAAVVVVAGVIGISGIYPQVIDAEWVQDAGTHLPIMSLSTAATKRVPGTAAAVPVAAASRHDDGPERRPRRRAPRRRLNCRKRTSVAAVAPPPASTRPQAPAVPAGAAPMAVADIPDAEAKADALPPDPAPAAAKPAEKPKVVVKKKVVVASPTRLQRGLRPVWRVGRCGAAGVALAVIAGSEQTATPLIGLIPDIWFPNVGGGGRFIFDTIDIF